MLLHRHFERLLLGPADLKPSHDDFEVVGVFNPGAIVAGDEVILLVRVAERPRERRPGFTASPRWVPGEGPTIDWLPDDTIDVLDPRVVKGKSDGLVRLTFISHLRAVRCGDGRSVQEVSDAPFFPDSEMEEFGVEDPRITAFGDRYYFTYVAVSRHGAATALASTTDFRAFERHGIIFCPENKDVVLFPEKIGGEYVALHRPNAATPFCRPEMWIARSPDLIHWGRHECLHGGGAEWETGRVGAGTPPVRVDAGWLEDLPRQPQTDPRRRSRDVFDGCVIARRRQSGEDPPSHGRIDLRADGRFRAQGLRAGCRLPHGDCREGGLVPGLLRCGRLRHGGRGIRPRRVARERRRMNRGERPGTRIAIE